MVKKPKQESIVVKIVGLIVLLAIAIGLAVFARVDDGQASAAVNELKYAQPSKEYFDGNEGYTVRVYVSKDLYDSCTAMKITYQRVKLNFYTDAITASGGECTDETKDGKPVYEVLDEKGTVAIDAKTELKESTSSVNEGKYYFELNTKVNCAYVFTVTKTAYGGAEDDVFYSVYYVRKIDNAAPSVTSVSASLVGTTQVRIKINFTDCKIPVADATGKNTFEDPGCARSGVTEIEVTDADTNQVAEKRQFVGVGANGTASYDFIGEFNHTYDIKLTDGVGNARAKRVSYKNEVYNADAETLYATATTGEGDDKLTDYSRSIQNAVNDAYGKYFEATRGVNSTNEEKQAALKELNAALKLYTDAKARLKSGHKLYLDVECTADGTAFSELNAIGLESALGYLPIGDNVTVSLIGTYYAKPNMPKDAEAMISAVDADVKKPTEAYRIVMRTISDSEGEQSTSLDGTAEIEFNVGSYKNAVAIIAKYSANGEVVYEKCNLTKRQTEGEDEVVSITMPYTAGTITLLVEREANKNLYWLFSLAALPLLVGGAMLIYAFNKMKKIKEQAAARDGEPAHPTPEEDKGKKPVPKNKKKKK